MLKVETINQKLESWGIIGDKNAVDIRGNIIRILDNKNVNGHGEFFLFSSDLQNKELTITLKDIQIDSQDSIFNLFVAAGDISSCIKSNESIYRLGITQHNYLSRLNNTYRKSKLHKDPRNSKYKIEITEAGIEAYIEENGKLVLFDKITVDWTSKQLSLGINCNNLGNDLNEQYQAWLSMNYLQLRYDKNDDAGKVWIDYYMHPKKNYRYDNVIFEQFLDIEYYDSDEIREIFGDVYSFVKWCINNNYYVSIPLNEFYIPQRDSYEVEEYYHHNLIYGLNEETEKMNIMGYGRKLINSEISFEQFKTSCLKTSGEIVRYKFSPNIKSFELNIRKMCEELSDFIKERHNDSIVIAETESLWGLHQQEVPNRK